MNRKNTQAKINKAPLNQLNDNIRIRGAGYLLIMLTLLFSIVSCNDEKERQQDTVQVLSSYNRAIEEFHRRAAELRMTFDRSVIVGFNMEQNLWEVVREDHKLDSIEQAFFDKHGEHAFNELSLLISDNFDRKMRK